MLFTDDEAVNGLVLPLISVAPESVLDTWTPEAVCWIEMLLPDVSPWIDNTPFPASETSTLPERSVRSSRCSIAAWSCGSRFRETRFLRDRMDGLGSGKVISRPKDQL